MLCKKIDFWIKKSGGKKIYEELLAFVFCDEMRIIQERT